MKPTTEVIKALGITALALAFFAPLPGQAQMFTDCMSNEQACRYPSSVTARAEAQARETARCKAVNDAHAAWVPRLQRLTEAVKAMDQAAASQKWDVLRSSFAKAKAPMLELQALVVQHPEGSNSCQALHLSAPG